MNTPPILRAKAFVVVGLFITLLVACSSSSATATPGPTATPTPIPPTEVSAGGFSFQPIAGFSLEINAAKARMAGRDENVELRASSIIRRQA